MSKNSTKQSIKKDSKEIEKNKDTQVETEFKEITVKFMLTEVFQQEEILSEIKRIIETLDRGLDGKGFNSWPFEKLISAREKLSRYSEPIGDFISLHESKSDFAYIWRKGKYASDWLPIKNKIKETIEKPTKDDVDSILIPQLLEVQYYSMLHRRRADLLIRELQAVDRILRSIDSRIREMERQFRLEHTPDKE